MTLTPEQLRGLVEAVLVTRAEELDCGEWLDRAGALAEAVVRGDPGAGSESLRLVREHLDICPECREEFEALLAALRDTGP